MIRPLVKCWSCLAIVSVVGFVGGVPSAGAAANPWPHDAVGFLVVVPGDSYEEPVFADGSTGTGTQCAEQLPLVAPIVDAGNAGPAGYGLYVAAADGGVFTCKTLQPGIIPPFHGSMGGRALNQPIVGIATVTHFGSAWATSWTTGYWLAAADGGVFTFGPAARFYGSLGGTPLNAPIVDIVAYGDDGYWLLAADGGVFAFGDAPFLGSLPGIGVHVSDVVGLASTVADPFDPSDEGGYVIARANGQLYEFGSAPKLADHPAPADDPVVAISSWNWVLVHRSGVIEQI